MPICFLIGHAAGTMVEAAVCLRVQIFDVEDKVLTRVWSVGFDNVTGFAAQLSPPPLDVLIPAVIIHISHAPAEKDGYVRQRSDTLSYPAPSSQGKSDMFVFLNKVIVIIYNYN